MRKAYSLAAAMVLSSTVAVAADPVPVIELQVEESSTSNSFNPAMPSSNNGEMLMLLQQLQDEMRQLRGMVESQQHQIRQMEQQQRDRYRDLDRRISAQQSTAQSPPPVSSGATAPAQPSPSPVTLPAADSTPTDAQAYQSAFALVRQKQFAEALKAFDKFIELYPDSARLPNAWYWIGEVNLAEQQLEMSKAAFEHVLKQYPEHRKASDASYKLGVIYHQMGDKDNADEMFKSTISRYPDSSAAGLARDYLKR